MQIYLARGEYSLQRINIFCYYKKILFSDCIIYFSYYYTVNASSGRVTNTLKTSRTLYTNDVHSTKHKIIV